MINSNKANDPKAVRYALLEALMEEEQKLTTEQVANALGVSMGHTGRIIREYLSENPQAWVYSAAIEDRCWVPGQDYQRVYLDESTDEARYLDRYCELTGIDREELLCYRD